MNRKVCSAARETRHYFKRGFCCGTIVHFLAEYHDHEISLNVKTLKRRRLRQFGFDEETILSEHAIQVIIKGEIAGRSSTLLGYRG